MNVQLETYVEVAVTYFKALLLLLPEETEESYKTNPARMTGLLGEIETRNPCLFYSRQAYISGHEHYR
jgi:hypothetical protein